MEDAGFPAAQCCATNVLKSCSQLRWGSCRGSSATPLFCHHVIAPPCSLNISYLRDLLNDFTLNVHFTLARYKSGRSHNVPNKPFESAFDFHIR